MKKLPRKIKAVGAVYELVGETVIGCVYTYGEGGDCNSRKQAVELTDLKRYKSYPRKIVDLEITVKKRGKQ